MYLQCGHNSWFITTNSNDDEVNRSEPEGHKNEVNLLADIHHHIQYVALHIVHDPSNEYLTLEDHYDLMATCEEAFYLNQSHVK